MTGAVSYSHTRGQLYLAGNRPVPSTRSRSGPMPDRFWCIYPRARLPKVQPRAGQRCRLDRDRGQCRAGVVHVPVWLVAPGLAAGIPAPSTWSRSRPMPSVVSCSCRRGTLRQVQQQAHQRRWPGRARGRYSGRFRSCASVAICRDPAADGNLHRAGWRGC